MGWFGLQYEGLSTPGNMIHIKSKKVGRFSLHLLAKSMYINHTWAEQKGKKLPPLLPLFLQTQKRNAMS